MVVLENLKPGDMVVFQNIPCILVAKLPRKSGKLSCLFDNNFVFNPEDAFRLEDTDINMPAFTMFEDTFEMLANHGLVIGDNVERLFPGQVVLVANIVYCGIKKIAVVDKPRKMIFDENGNPINFLNNFVIDTGFTVNVEGLLTEEGRKLIEMMYPE